MFFRETAGEEDHSAYNLRILKKPIYALTDGSIMPNNDLSSMNNLNKYIIEKYFHICLGYNDPRNYHRPPLDDYIEEKLGEQVISHANDTQLHYQYEGVGSIAGDLSSIESSSLQDENDYRFLYTLGPKFSRLADLYADHNDDI